MEIEYKWKMPIIDIEKKMIDKMPVGTCIKTFDVISMHSSYYDTVDKKLKKRNIALRIRKENEKEICYLKIRIKEDTNLFVRNEYLIETGDLKQGFDYFIAKTELKDLFNDVNFDDINEICAIDFERRLYWINYSFGDAEFDAELCFDIGWGKKKIKTPISEIELELVNGDEELFRDYATKFEELFMLDREDRSKIAQIK